jgi:RNA polymerase sigma-70 factor (ECF subfamily)
LTRLHPCPGAASEAAADLRTATDEALVEGLRRGSERHFDALYDRYFPRVYAFVRARVRDRADAEELTQECFTAVFRSIGAYSGRSTPLAWIYGVAKNTVNNHLRRARAQSERLGADLAGALHPLSGGWAATPLEDLELRRSLRRMDERLRGVTRWQAEVFWLRHVDDLSIDEIAQRLKRSNDAIRSSLYRVKRLLVDAAAAGALASQP